MEGLVFRFGKRNFVITLVNRTLNGEVALIVPSSRELQFLAHLVRQRCDAGFLRNCGVGKNGFPYNMTVDSSFRLSLAVCG
jgi:hypothetical protein